MPRRRIFRSVTARHGEMVAVSHRGNPAAAGSVGGIVPKCRGVVHLHAVFTCSWVRSDSCRLGGPHAKDVLAIAIVASVARGPRNPAAAAAGLARRLPPAGHRPPTPRP